MTANRRIILNTLVTYGRSLLALIFGVFSARWVLMALGETDLGLFGVVGSIILCVQLLNIVMSTAVARFFAYAIGEAKNLDSDRARDLLMDWFNAAMTVHIVLPVLLVAIGYPVGVLLIKHWLVVPENRVCACLWVFRFSLVSAFVGMISVPYIAMYRAKQLIAELTVWEIIRTFIVFGGAFSLLYVGGDKLIIYAVIMSFSPISILSIQVYRAHVQFDCCRIRISSLFCAEKIKKIVAFGCCDLFSSLGCIVRDQGASLLINKIFGPIVNSAYGIANQLSSQTNTLASAMNGALLPAITTCEGEGNRDTAIALAHQSCKFCAFLVLIFAIPLYLEVDEILRVWLINPPTYTAVLCKCILVTAVCFKLGWGYHMAICAKGKVAMYQFCVGSVSILSLPAMIVMVKFFGVIGVGGALILNAIALSSLRVVFARRLLGVSVTYWLLRVVAPICMVSAITCLSSVCVGIILEGSFMRVCVTGMVSVVTLMVSGWCFVLDSNERKYLTSRIKLVNW